MDEEQVYQCDVWFSGHVQGVGFRYSTRQVAKQFEVRGQVRNLDDGRVYLEVESDTQEEAHAFLSELQSQMSHFIRETETQDAWGQARFRGFNIVG